MLKSSHHHNNHHHHQQHHHQQLHVHHSNNSNSSTCLPSSSSSQLVNGVGSTNAHSLGAHEKCTYCLNSLANVAIRCAECPNFILCLKVIDQILFINFGWCFLNVRFLFNFRLISLVRSVFLCQPRLAITKKTTTISSKQPHIFPYSIANDAGATKRSCCFFNSQNSMDLAIGRTFPSIYRLDLLKVHFFFIYLSLSHLSKKADLTI